MSTTPYETSSHPLDQFVDREAAIVLAPQDVRQELVIRFLQEGPQLAEQLFVEPKVLSQNAPEQPNINLESRGDDILFLPTRNFVHAVQFRNWQDGREGRKDVGGISIPSRRVIKQYARRRTPFPPIDLVHGYVQPSGVALYCVVRDGAHRVAAAHRRQDEKVPVRGRILLTRLEEDIVV